jgi:prepilin-type N-terminal cleavage/methylation domain-containing protein
MKSKSVRSSSERRAFTLIELLVVIAIIAILAAMLLPVLASAKNRAQMVTDLDNIKQMMLATHMYANDSSDYLPMPGGWNWMGSPCWAAGANFPLAPGGSGSTLATYNSFIDPQTASFKQGQLGSYLQNIQALLCPADIQDANFYMRQEYISTYVCNGAVIDYGDPGKNNIAHKLTDILVKPTRVLFWENNEKLIGNTLYAGQWNDFSNWPDQGLSTRHGKGATVGVMDGGSKRMPIVQFYAEAGNDSAGNPIGAAGDGYLVAIPQPPNDLGWWFQGMAP